MGTGKVFWLTHTHGKVYGLLFMAKIFSFKITTLLAILSLYHQIPLCNESTKLYHNSFTHYLVITLRLGYLKAVSTTSCWQTISTSEVFISYVFSLLAIQLYQKALLYHRVLNKIKIVVRISSRKGRI